ncbi:MAG: type II toxin-antitoxin system RelE/ParE family toxin [Rhodoferax sp.]|jgi:plasmid stabilization system protein ParE|uniref:type II toxin-antitoxin system RelE/ParE family toxin n=1 Tax=Rhodoferax sp. TaxID=50421 RepID=UPI003BB09188
MVTKLAVKLTANFESNLVDIERFLSTVEAPQAYDDLLDELLDTVIPNLQRFPAMGRPFFNRAVGSVEATNALTTLSAKLKALLAEPDSLHEYVMDHYLVLYARVAGHIDLLSIKHHRQLSFNFEAHWGAKSSR